MNAMDPFDPQTAMPSVSINDLQLFLRRNILTIILSLAISIGLGIAYLSVTPPKYTATAKLLIEGPTGQYLQGTQASPELPIDASQLESEI